MMCHNKNIRINIRMPLLSSSQCPGWCCAAAGAQRDDQPSSQVPQHCTAGGAAAGGCIACVDGVNNAIIAKFACLRGPQSTHRSMSGRPANMSIVCAVGLQPYASEIVSSMLSTYSIVQVEASRMGSALAASRCSPLLSLCCLQHVPLLHNPMTLLCRLRRAAWALR
jgi:hypothetical protein